MVERSKVFCERAKNNDNNNNGWAFSSIIQYVQHQKERAERKEITAIQVLKKIMIDDVVEFKGEFYNIPACKIGPKPFQKPHPPIYMGAFSPKAFRRIVNYADGWIGMIVGTLENFENTMNTIKDMANKEANKDANRFKIVLLTYPKLMEDSSSSKKEEEGGQRPPLTGTIDEIGGDLKRIKDMEVEHIIFGYSFSPIGGDISNMIGITKQLSTFCS
jgi:alkanesulfonate monooxygenase SsuD/methylene tetrahydromethanopterin reductase-like flavin-dependent oxidoreductase (luciferase family)